MSELSRRLGTSRAQWLDLLLALSLTGLALTGFSTAFDGADYLIVGLSAAVLGAAVSWLSAKLQVRWISAFAVFLVVFVLAGQAFATRGRAVAGVVPTPDALRGLVDGIVHGWSRLLTSLPRSGTEDNLLAVPYLLGFVSGLTSAALALKVKRWALCVVPPFGLLAVVALLGTAKPASILLQGILLAVAALGWASWRQQRDLPNIKEQAGRRLVRAALLLAVAGAIGQLLGPGLPLAQAQQRLTLRDHVVPPFDLRDQPSPLGAFRAWQDKDRKATPQAELRNWPAGTRLRLAAMDSYDGLVWNLAGTRPGSSAVYERVGTTLPGADNGKVSYVTVTPGANVGLYVPTAGRLRSVKPLGPVADALVGGLRVSRSTDTAIETRQAPAGTSYRVGAVLGPAPSKDALDKAAFEADVILPDAYAIPTDLKTQLDGNLASAKSPYEKAVALQDMLHESGYYSDGGKDSGVPPGHSLARIVPMLAHPETARGNGEQYAAAMALAARALGMPARVVIGFAPKGSGTVTVVGDDVAAWVEIDFHGVGWVAFDPTPPKDRVSPEKPPPLPRKQQVRPQVPPLIKPQAAAADLAAERVTKASQQRKARVVSHHGIVVRVLLATVKLGLLLLVVLSPVLAIVGYKVRRRRRRESQGDPARRISAGWQEVLDTARDAGHDLPVHGTRTEVARALGIAEADALASSADRATFAADLPHEQDASQFWSLVSQVRTALTASLTWRQKLRVAVSLRSLRTAT